MLALDRLLLYKSGKPMSGVEPTGDGRGLLRSWNEDGTLILEAAIDANREYDGHYRSWWDIGVLKEEGDYRAGKRIGTYRWYLESGELWSQHTYD